MLTGEIRSQIDRIWMAFFTGGISNPLEEERYVRNCIQQEYCCLNHFRNSLFGFSA